MKISIITVCYNSEQTIEDTIQSVLAQTYKNIEYIIVDGKSKDSTCTIINKYKDQISKFISEPDKGIYDAMNKGISLATGDVVGILNSDDIYADNLVLSRVAKSIKDLDAVYGNLNYVSATNTDKIFRRWVSKPYLEGMFFDGWMPPHPTFYVKKSVYEKYGSYSLKLKSAADYEFMLRVIHKYKIQVKYIDSILIKMRVGGESNASIKNRIRANREDREAWRMNNLKPKVFTLLRKPLSKIFQFIKKGTN